MQKDVRGNVLCRSWTQGVYVPVYLLGKTSWRSEHIVILLPDLHRRLPESVIATVVSSATTAHKTDGEGLENSEEQTLTVSVLPVPAGPCRQPPLQSCRALVRVRKHRSVRGVTTSRDCAPRYSYPYSKIRPACCTVTPEPSAGSVNLQPHRGHA